MAFNRNKFLSALLDMEIAPAEPTNAPNLDLAKFLNAHAYGVPDLSTDAAIEMEKRQRERDEGALSKTFGWMMSLGNMNENILMDMYKPDTSVGEKLKNIGVDVAAGATNFVHPVAEALTPGFQYPGEDAVSDWLDKNNKQYHGQGAISGSKLLKERFGWTGEDTGDRIGRALTGFGIDVAVDPLTYLPSLGIAGKVKKLVKGEELAPVTAAADNVAPTVEKALEAKATGMTGNVTPFVKPPAKPVIPPSTIASDPTRQFRLEPPTNVPSQLPTNEWGMSPVQEQIMRTGILGLNPEAAKGARGARLTDIRLYEKLRPVQFPESRLRITKNTRRDYEMGQDFMQHIGLDNLPTDRPLTRDDLRQLFDWVQDAAREENVALRDPKYWMRGVEDYLKDQGFDLQAGRMSDYLASLKKKKPDYTPDELSIYTKGKPLKERPNVIDPADAKDEAYWKQREHIVGQGMRGVVKAPGEGINPIGVERTMEQMARGGLPAVYPIEPVADLALRAEAIRGAEEIYAGMGKKAAGITRRADLTPANQANLYNKMYGIVQKYLSDNPSLRGKAVTKRNRAWSRQQALAMTKHAEDYLEKTHGLRGKHWNGSGLKVTDAISHLGPDALDDHITKVLDAFRKGDPSLVTEPVAKAAIERATAQRALEMSGVQKVILDGWVDKSRQMEDLLSPQKYLAWKNRSIKQAHTDAMIAGATKSEADAVVDLLRGTINTRGLDTLEPQQVVEAIGQRMVEAVLEGRATPQEIRKMNQAIMRQLGEKESKIMFDVDAKSAVDSFLMRMTTWAGRGPMQNYAKEGYAALESMAKERADWFSRMSKDYSKDEIKAAFMFAQDVFRTYDLGSGERLVEKASPRVQLLAAQMRDYFENVIGSHSVFANLEDAAGVQSIRMGLTMEDIDRQLAAVGSNFQFGKYRKAKKSIHGTDVDYQDDWRLAWENVDPEKLGQTPDKFMYDLDLAVQRVAVEYSLIDDMIMRFGRRKGEAGFDPTIHNTSVFTHHRIPHDVKFHPDIAKAFGRLQKDIEQGPWIPKSKAAKFYFKALRMWKSGVTIYNPAHHLRNLIGDSWNMWAAGINDPRVFEKSWRIIQSQRARYKDALNDPTLDRLRGLISKKEFDASTTTGQDVIINKYGSGLTAHELYGEAYQRGLLRDATRVEDIVGSPLFAQSAGKNPNAIKQFLAQPLAGKGHQVATTVAEVREHYVRMAHFVGQVEKDITPALAKRLQRTTSVGERRAILRDVYEKASKEVNKWHPDGRDLTQFEQKWMRGLVPFYSWQRKIIPLLVETMATRPSKILAYPRANFALQQMLGIDAEGGPSDPFPYDQLYPNWLRAGGIGPIGDPQSDNPFAQWFGKLGRNNITPSGEERGYTVIDPGNPFNDTVSEYFGMGTPGDTIQGLGGMLTPAFNIPKDIVTQTRNTGAPIPESEGGEGWAPWAAEQVPIAAILQRILEPGETQAQGTEPGINTQALLNYLTAMGITGSGAYLKSAQFDEREAARKR